MDIGRCHRSIDIGHLNNIILTCLVAGHAIAINDQEMVAGIFTTSDVEHQPAPRPMQSTKQKQLRSQITGIA